MTIQGYTKDEFGQKLAGVVNPARPISSIEHLKGREEQLQEIERALYAPGRHIFIYGDRGVGKSSLAATAAYVHQSPDAAPILVSGSPDETFNSIVANIALKALQRSKVESTKVQRSQGIDFRGVKFSNNQEISALDLSGQIRSIGDATELLKQVAEKHSAKPTIVLDEFDTIPAESERAKFASLLKQLGDQSVDLKFFITGVGKSCQDLLGAHPSAYRQLATIELHRLPWEGRMEIVESAAAAFGLDVDRNVSWRIAIISDGFPYYIHLIVEKMLWQAFDASADVSQLGWGEFYSGLRVAVRETNAELRRPYEKAVLCRDPVFEDVVWSTADGEDLLRSQESMFASYQRIAGAREARPSVERTKYNELIRKLRDPAYGEVLRSVIGRKAWYEYSEKMLRGFVRMQAEANEVPLTGEHPNPRPVMHIGNTRTGSYGPSIPRGVKVGRSSG